MTDSGRLMMWQVVFNQIVFRKLGQTQAWCRILNRTQYVYSHRCAWQWRQSGGSGVWAVAAPGGLYDTQPSGVNDIRGQRVSALRPKRRVRAASATGAKFWGHCD